MIRLLYLTLACAWCGQVMPFVVKPIHIPILLAVGIALLSQSDARSSKTLKKTVGYHQQNHKVSGMRRIVNKQHPLPSQVLGRIDNFSRRVYMDLGKSDWNATATADVFGAEFAQLNIRTGGVVGEALSTLVELRLLDLQMSVRRARLMRDVVGIMLDNCTLCIPS